MVSDNRLYTFVLVLKTFHKSNLPCRWVYHHIISTMVLESNHIFDHYHSQNAKSEMYRAASCLLKIPQNLGFEPSLSSLVLCSRALPCRPMPVG